MDVSYYSQSLGRLICLGALSFILLFVSAESGWATDYDVIAGSEISIASVTGDADVIKAILPSTRSFCITIHSRDSSFVRFGTESGLSQFTAVARGSANPPVNRNGVPDAANAARKCLFAPEGSTNRREIFAFPIQVGSGTTTNGTANNVNVALEQTSLIGGYNTSITEFNFLEITASAPKVSPLSLSLESVEIKGVVIVQNVVNPTTHELPFTITTDDKTGLARIDINIHLLVGDNSFGPVIINHDGPPGSITARTVQYKITEQNPLEFVPVLEQQFVKEGSQP